MFAMRPVAELKQPEVRPARLSVYERNTTRISQLWGNDPASLVAPPTIYAQQLQQQESRRRMDAKSIAAGPLLLEHKASQENVTLMLAARALRLKSSNVKDYQ